jgi:hypothetical protein
MKLTLRFYQFLLDHSFFPGRLIMLSKDVTNGLHRECLIGVHGNLKKRFQFLWLVNDHVKHVLLEALNDEIRRISTSLSMNLACVSVVDLAYVKRVRVETVDHTITVDLGWVQSARDFIFCHPYVVP